MKEDIERWENMKEETVKHIEKLSELIQKSLETLDSVLEQFISIIQTLPDKEQLQFRVILRNFTDSMKNSITELELALHPIQDSSNEYIT